MLCRHHICPTTADASTSPPSGNLNYGQGQTPPSIPLGMVPPPGMEVLPAPLPGMIPPNNMNGNHGKSIFCDDFEMSLSHGCTKFCVAVF